MSEKLTEQERIVNNRVCPKCGKTGTEHEQEWRQTPTTGKSKSGRPWRGTRYPVILWCKERKRA